jgi:hypothetical protein
VDVIVNEQNDAHVRIEQDGHRRISPATVWLND